jgi:hypothetical protein
MVSLRRLLLVFSVAEVLPMSVAGKLILLVKSAPVCRCGDDCEVRKFFTAELERLVDENDWIEELEEDKEESEE